MSASAASPGASADIYDQFTVHVRIPKQQYRADRPGTGELSRLVHNSHHLKLAYRNLENANNVIVLLV